MNMLNAQDFLLNGLQDLTGDEMAAIGGGYGPGSSTPPSTGGGSCYGCPCPPIPPLLPPGTNPYGR